MVGGAITSKILEHKREELSGLEQNYLILKGWKIIQYNFTGLMLWQKRINKSNYILSRKDALFIQEKEEILNQIKSRRSKGANNRPLKLTGGRIHAKRERSTVTKQCRPAA